MASRRMTRETFDAVMQAKAKRYRLERSDPIDEALHQLRVHSRPVAPRTRYSEDFIDDSEYPRDDWREETREDFSLASYRSRSPVAEEDDYYNKSYDPPSRTRDYAHPTSRERDYGRSTSVDRDFDGPPNRDREYDHPASRKREYDHIPSRKTSRLHDAEYASSDLLSDFRSLRHLEEDYSSVQNQANDLKYGFELEREFNPSLRGRGRGKRGMVTRGMVKNKGGMDGPIKKWEDKRLPRTDDQLEDSPDHPKQRIVSSYRPQISQRPSLAFQRGVLHPGSQKSIRSAQDEELNLDLANPSDIFSTFGIEIIKWAGFHQCKKDPEYMELYRMLFSLETETCAKMLASFKCSLKPEHRDFCFSIVRPLQHAALKSPKVDNEFLKLLLDKGVMLTKNCFFKVIKPFDQYMMRLQDHLLKSTTPLLMACNAYELSIKTSSFSDRAQMAAAFETTVSLCRKSLALLGQTFSLASAFRQEKILEAIGVQESAPPPTMYPNFDTSALFGREYIEVLQNWMEKSGCPVELKREAPEPLPQNQRNVPETRPKIKIPQRADRKVVETIEKLVNIMISRSLKGKEKAELKGNPEYWFLHEEESLEFKYYKLKLSEMERLMSTPKEEPKKTPEQLASETMRAILRARTVASVKRRLFRRKRPGILQRAARARKVRKATVGTQTLLSAGTMLKQQRLHDQGSAASLDTGSSSGKASPSICDGGLEEALSAEEVPAAGPSVEVPGPAQSSACQFPDVDAKTMETAEKLAKFVAQVGPEIEQFSIDNSADNPDLWFLQDRESSAFKYYRTKVYELCPSINFSSVEETADPSESPEQLEGDGGEEEEEAEFEEEVSQMELEREGDEEEAVPPDDEAEEDMLAEEGAEKTEEPDTAEEGQAGTSSEGAALRSVSQAASDAPPQRKRISSKSLKVGMIPPVKRVCHVQEPEVHEPVRIAYDRPRGYSSYKKKFQKTKDMEFRHNKLTRKNIGFQMLKKMGWQEGRGLGSHGDGIREPIKVGSTSAGEGLGVAGEENKEDTFDTFRQRMINMYNLKRGSK
ncbi:SURP and G-patch domain-containing protein 2 [Eublepharis macularius]|uniref:SURP and G-patch domain-containing protein 2 n=1 Tax=Eublepharis macularius TaxID=481883 RepID=A0AA97JE77_EUBMA|nr:SURP and G-patch domain-containing protein 2 [Eublepharis macularius]XP_054835642.1 SURP and G-patch domain-containing protein 2 [Eublepharis macularius]XP_054835643.1 SURP and G-patch domain-containing protein 2 [Eublepharis macularius]XP_054835644.1 SURP and G-patch domain-containing protein 2 [Eublepharis macularius]XP_054835646.1 SURP and G-patch domain-containing protein 2 [Eublepharis macularius]XP_054835647.1 SURP and G-patch domain-containing protein 2 [Eublepharis macularius]XP_05